MQTTIYITKYATTRGIIEAKAKLAEGVSTPEKPIWRAQFGRMHAIFFEGRTCFLTEAAARVDMRKKLESAWRAGERKQATLRAAIQELDRLSRAK
jgi:hypothetical protein